MQEIIFIIHILAAICLICLVLIQHGKGADMGAAFGSGASNTVFGGIGSIPFLIKVTAVVAALFFTTSIMLGVVVAKKVKQESISKQIPAMPFKRN
jgi:preprotein translocase subunit SecG